MHTKRWLILAMALLAAGCKPSGSGTTVARVDNEALTLEDVRARLDSASGASEGQVQQYIRRWLNDEVLYREALRQGLDKAPGLDDRVNDFRRQSIINALLQKIVYTDQSAESSSEQVRAYYDAHRNEFPLQQDVVLVSMALFSNRDAATEFRNSIVKGTLWSQALAQAETSPKRSMNLLGRADSLYHSQQSFVPPELWRVASALKERETSFPVSTNNGFYVLTVWKFFKQGQAPDLKLVQSEIRGRLAVQRRIQVYDSLVNNLRARHSVEVFHVPVGGDSAAVRTVE